MKGKQIKHENNKIENKPTIEKTEKIILLKGYKIINASCD